MATYKIITDSGCDLPAEMLQELDVSRVSLSVLFRGETREDSVDAGIKDLYDALRAGEISTTSAVNGQDFGRHFVKVEQCTPACFLPDCVCDRG